jgi:hypothetical protein
MKNPKHPHKRPSTNSANTDPNANATSKDGVQGEGNYAAAREFNAAERKFVESGKVDAAARAAAPKNEAERQEMLAAEQVGKSRAKEDYPPPPETSPKGGAATPREPAKDAPRNRR